MIKINREKLNQYGFEFNSSEDMFFYISSLIDYLKTHNKNYTKEQYNRILTLEELMEAIDVE